MTNPTATAAEYLQQTSLLRLIAVLALVLGAHLPALPGWEVALVAAGLGWRLLAARRQWSLPPSWLRSLLAVLVFAGIYLSYGRINGQQPGTALIVAMAVLKLLEMRSRRDVMVTVFLMYFILLTHFLNSQEMWTIVYLLVSAVAITALLVDVNHAGRALPLRVALRISTRMVALSLPLMLVFFILFPRVPGPLWGLPADAGAALTGMSEEMSPGDISSLSQSDEVAFRVRFFGPPPPRNQRYWRGPVLENFDGRAWRPSPFSRTLRTPDAELHPPAVEYEVVMEPHRGPWLFALDLPDPRVLPPRSFVASEYQLLQNGEVQNRLLFRLRSYPNHRFQLELPQHTLRSNLLLPLNLNPRTQALARRWRETHARDEDVVEAALQMFRSEPFHYTLQPPLLGRHSVDDFLFGSRRGFCEHYSSAFTLLMRAAGIPARVVTGYLGGEQNAIGDYFLVRQSDAHAWSEVWLEGKGWVRVDPTAAVAPDRIEQGLAAALDDPEGVRPANLSRQGKSWITLDLRARWDWMNMQWNQWVLAYGPELQQQFLQRFGIRDWSGMILALTVIGSLLMAGIGLLLVREYAAARSEDPALRLWHRAQRRLQKRGLVQRPGEGPQDFIARAMEEAPELAPALKPLLAAYLELRYLGSGDRAALAALERAVKALPR